MMEDVIFAYLGIMDGKGWDHPNYTAFIHAKETKHGSNAKDEYFIMMLGANFVGKTSLLWQLLGWQGWEPDIEDSYRKSIMVQAREVILDIFDSAGRELKKH